MATLKRLLDAVGVRESPHHRPYWSADKPRSRRRVIEFTSHRYNTTDKKPVIRLNCIRDHVITLQRVHNGDGDRPAAGS